MLNIFSSKKIARFSLPLLLAASVAMLSGCGGGGAAAGTAAAAAAAASGAPTIPVNDAIALSTSVTSIKTDNSNSATLTATVTLTNALAQGVPVTFSTTSGNLSALTATSDATGKATVTLFSGASDFSNRTATITATAGGKSASIPVLISGSTLSMAASATTVQAGIGTINLAATASDAGAIGKSGQTVRFSIGATSTGAGTLSAATLLTGVSGSTANVIFTPTAAGNVVVVADWLDAAGAVSITTTKNITVTAAIGVAFAITAPATDPLSLTTAGTQALTVTVPATMNGIAVANVRISSTSGTWTGAAPAAGPAASITQTPALNSATATFTASANSGVATVQVDALSATNAVLATLTRTFVISAPATAASSLNIQTSVATIVPSSGTNSSTATLTATVRDASLNAVGNAAVIFELLGTTGSGESIAPAVAYTDGTGKATAIFTAGSAPTVGSIYARARVVGETCAGAPQGNPAIPETNPLCGSTPLTVVSTAVSVSIGFGTTVTDTANATQYLLPGSVLVVNSNGSAVANATVTLSVFPFEYRNGTITLNPGVGCVPPATSFVASEDINRNGILDAGEDTPLAQTAAQIAAGTISLNGVLSPSQASGGAIPLTVTTDSFGAATFNLQYPKSSAFFIKDEVTARVIVLGSERSAKTAIILPMSIPDGYTGTCALARTATY